MAAELTSPELERYSRHLLIPEVGRQGQQRLKESSVLLVGNGALGSPAAIYLAAAGVGRLALVDPDRVEISNLQRQVIHGESWVGKPKLESAAARLREINPHVQIDLHPLRFAPDNANELAAPHDLIVDGSDNFPTRFLTNDVGFFQRKPVVYGAIHRFEGQTTVFAPHLGGPCYRCLLPEMPAPGSVPSCAEAGVLGVLPGIIGSLQAMEAIKLLLGIGEVPLGQLTVYDALRSDFRKIRLRPDPGCRLCGTSPNITGIDNAETRASATCDLNDPSMKSISTRELREKIRSGLDGLLLDVRQPEEYAVANIEQARLIPLAELESALDSLPKDQAIYIHCKAGGRSAKAVKLMTEHGFMDVTNVSGGMDAWLNED